MTQHFKFVLSHYINVFLILYNSCCQNKIMSVSVSIYIFVLHLLNCIEYTINPNLMIEICTKTSSISLFTLLFVGRPQSLWTLMLMFLIWTPFQMFLFLTSFLMFVIWMPFLRTDLVWSIIARDFRSSYLS